MTTFCDLLYQNNLKWLARILNCREPAPPPPPNQKWTVTNNAVTITADQRSASAVKSLVVRGYEYIEFAMPAGQDDRGALYQTALQIDGGGEGNNPTEAGSSIDHGPVSSSRIISCRVDGSAIIARSQLCYWIPYQGQTLSDITLDKRIELGWGGRWNIIKDTRTLHNPRDHQTAMFECLTAYVRLAMNRLYEFDPSDGSIKQIPYTPSVQFPESGLPGSDLPIIVALPAGTQAMGIMPKTGFGSGFWGGAGGYSNKWVCGQPHMPFPRGDYSWTVYLAVGDLMEVKEALVYIHNTLGAAGV
jgi:hypothetical protein